MGCCLPGRTIPKGISTRLNEKTHAAPDGAWPHFAFGCYKHFTSNEVHGTPALKRVRQQVVSVFDGSTLSAFVCFVAFCENQRLF